MNTLFTLFQDYYSRLYRAQWLLPRDDEPQWFHGRDTARLDPEEAKLDVFKAVPDAVYMETEAFQVEVERRLSERLMRTVEKLQWHLD